MRRWVVASVVVAASCGGDSDPTVDVDAAPMLDAPAIDAPPIDASPVDAPALSMFTVSPDPLSFGTLGAGTWITTQVTVHNTGATAIGSLAFSLTGTQASSFLIDSTGCAAALVPDALCVVDVTFKPPFPGEVQATLAVDAPDGVHRTVSLSGIAVNSKPFTVSPHEVAFGDVLLGSTGGPFTFTVSNPTAFPATVGVSPGQGTGPGRAFTIVDDHCMGQLISGASCTFGVAFTPTTTGEQEGQVSVPGAATNVYASGTGVEP